MTIQAISLSYGELLCYIIYFFIITECLQAKNIWLYFWSLNILINLLNLLLYLLLSHWICILLLPNALRLVWNSMILWSVRLILAYCLCVPIEINANFVCIYVYMLCRVEVITVLTAICSSVLTRAIWRLLYHRIILGWHRIGSIYFIL